MGSGQSHGSECGHYVMILKGISLIVLTTEDLTIDIIREKLRGLAPWRDLRGLQPMVGLLNDAGRRYQYKVKRCQAARAQAQPQQSQQAQTRAQPQLAAG